MLDYLKNHKLIAVVSASILLSLMLLGVILITNQSNDRFDQQDQSRDDNASQPVQHQDNSSQSASPTSSRDGKTLTTPLSQNSIKWLPNSETDKISTILAGTVTMNTKERSIVKPIIRANSLKRSYDDKTLTYITDFIVDLPKIQQSYRVHDEYTTVKQAIDNDYAVTIACPKPSDLIYPAFKCIDRFKIERGEV